MKWAWWLVTNTTRESASEQRQRRLQHAHLRVAVELQRVLLAHAGLHAAGGVEHEDVQRAERPLDLGEHRLNRLADR